MPWSRCATQSVAVQCSAHARPLAQMTRELLCAPGRPAAKDTSGADAGSDVLPLGLLTRIAEVPHHLVGCRSLHEDFSSRALVQPIRSIIAVSLPTRFSRSTAASLAGTGCPCTWSCPYSCRRDPQGHRVRPRSGPSWLLVSMSDQNCGRVSGDSWCSRARTMRPRALLLCDSRYGSV
jgi:hypothetical protein